MLGIENRDHVNVNEDAQVTISEQVAQFALQLGNGDLSAIGRLYDVSVPRLLRYAETLTRNRDDAEDALQAAMVRHPLLILG